MLAMALVQQGQQRHGNDSKDFCASTMAMTPLWQGQQHQLDHNNNTIATMATTLLQQWQRCLDYKDACVSTTATPLQRGWQRHLDDSKEVCASMTVVSHLAPSQRYSTIEEEEADMLTLTWEEVTIREGSRRCCSCTKKEIMRLKKGLQTKYRGACYSVLFCLMTTPRLWLKNKIMSFSPVLIPR